MSTGSLLLDADVVIEHGLRVFDDLVRRTPVAVVSIVAYVEAQYAPGLIPSPISLDNYVKSGLIHVESATADEMAAVVRRFRRPFVDGLHAGEVEALAVLLRDQSSHRYCTCDKTAIHAACMLDRSSRLVSLEQVLRKVGLSKSLEPKCGEKYFQRHVRMGQQKRITGEDLSVPP